MIKSKINLVFGCNSLPFFCSVLMKTSFSFIVFLLLGSTVIAQNQTLWFRADKGVNNSTTVPTSGTLVTTWYDQSTTDGTQNGVQATAHAGQTETQLPGLPTYRSNSNKLINFNPVIDFSNDDLGDALGFQNPAGLDQTIFVVFRAIGSGSGQYNQGLLYGVTFLHHLLEKAETVRICLLELPQEIDCLLEVDILVIIST